ncbi:MAG: glycosyltransferase family 4 protein [Verrucomicrobiota bacterium]
MNANPRRAVLLVGNFLSGDGGSRGVCEELAERLAMAGWAVLTASNKRNCLYRLAHMVRTVYARRQDYDVAHVDVYSGRAFFWAEAVCTSLRQVGKPFVLTLHGGHLPEFAERWPARVRHLLRSAKVVTTPSPYLQKTMQAYRANLRLVPNAIDLSRYRFRQRDHLPPSLVWLRAFHAIYNPMLGPKVLKLLSLRFPTVRLVMVGPDKGDGSIGLTQQVARQLGVDSKLCLPGGVAKAAVPAWLERGEFFLNTTNVDNTPVSVLEAMACGLCVVSTDVGGLPHLLEHERDALLVPPNNAEAMAAAVTRLLTNPQLCAQLSRNARAKAERHDWSMVLPEWEALLSSVASNGN